MKAQPLINTYLPITRQVGRLAVRQFVGRDVFTYDDIANSMNDCSYGRVSGLFSSNKDKFEEGVDSGYAIFNGQKFRWFSPSGLVKICLILRTAEAVRLLKEICIEWPQVANPRLNIPGSIQRPEAPLKLQTAPAVEQQTRQSYKAIPAIEQQMRKSYKMFIIRTSETRPSDSNEHERKFHVVAEDISKAIASTLEHVETNLKGKHVSVIYAAFHEHISIVAP